MTRCVKCGFDIESEDNLTLADMAVTGKAIDTRIQHRDPLHQSCYNELKND